MKRLFWASLLFLLILTSCRTTGEATSASLPQDSTGWYALLVNEESVEKRYNFIWALYNEGKYENVIEEADNAISLYPGYTRFLKIKAAAEREKGDGKAYLSTLSLVLEKEGYDESLRNLYSDALMENGEEEKELDFARQTILLYPKNEKALDVLSSHSAFYSYIRDTLKSQV